MCSSQVNYAHANEISHDILRAKYPVLEIGWLEKIWLSSPAVYHCSCQL